ncbi:MAG: hypothetical protein F6K30_06855 [Cyanothece sp. SIO2G6]|nr:hypothetical protein [Cyanothece sp. SIO2G6]
MTVQELVNAAKQLNLNDQMHLVGQLMQLVAQKLTHPTSKATTPLSVEDDPIVGMFSGPPHLSTEAKDILAQEIHSPSGFSWKE